MRYMQKKVVDNGNKSSAGIWDYDSRNGAVISSINKKYRRNEVNVYKAIVDPFTGEVSKGELLRKEDLSMLKMEYQLTFRQSLVALCEANDIDSETLAEGIGVRKQIVHHWFRDTMPTLLETVKICRFFGVSIDHFLRREPEVCGKISFRSKCIYDMLREADLATKEYNHLPKETKAQFRHGKNCRIRHIWKACDELGLSIDWLWKEASDGLAEEEEESD